MIEIQCPHCGAMMEPLPDTEWTDGRQRTIEILCPNCLHRETVYLAVRARRSHKTK